MKLIKNILLIGYLFISFPLVGQVNSEFFLQRGIKAYQQQKYKTAIQNFEQALAIDSTNIQCYSLLAASYLTIDKAESSEKISRSGLNQFKHNLNLKWLQAEALLQLKNYKQALANYESIANQQKTNGQLPANVTLEALQQRLGQLTRQLGQKAAEQKDYATAIDCFRKLKDYLPNDKASYINLALVYLKSEQWQNALQLAEQGLLKFPQLESLFKIMATALYQLKDFEALATVYKQLHQNNPEDLDITIAYGELLMGNQSFSTASEIYDKLLQKHPQERKIYESLIQIYEARFNYEGKLQILKQMVPHFAKAEVYEQIANTLETMNRRSEARQYYDTLLDYSAAKLPIKKKIGETYLAQDSLKKAQGYFEKLHHDYPGDEAVLQKLARLQEQQQQWSAALVSYEKLLAKDYSGKVLTRLGYIHQQLGKTAEALSYYRQAILKAEEPVAYWGAATLLQTSDSDRAFQLAEKALTIAFSQLQKQENLLQKMFRSGNAMESLNRNKELIEEVKVTDSVTTLIFNHLASYEYTKARQSILKLTKNFSESAKMHYLIGKFYHRHEQNASALQRLQLAARLNPNLWENQLLMGKIHWQNNQPVQAILAYERVLTLQKSNKEACQALVKLYQQQEQLDLLCDKWLARYQADQQNEILREHLIEALHKCGRSATAKKIIATKDDLKKDNL